MRVCHLSYRLKNHPAICRATFDSFEEAQEFMIEKGIQIVVGKPEVPNAHVLYETAAKNVKADWFEFSHEEIK